MDSARQWVPLDEHDDGQRSGSSTPTHAHEFSRLLTPSTSDNMLSHRPTRSHSTGSFVSSPLNPSTPMTPSQPRRLSSHGSMILYRMADDKAGLLPPKFVSARNSIISNSGDSFLSSFKSDSKYPSTILQRTPHGLIPYEYDPTLDQLEPPDDEDLLHDPRSDVYLKADAAAMPWRGVLNVGLLLLIILGLLTLFVFYPVYTWYTQLAIYAQEANNLRVNRTGLSSPFSFASLFSPSVAMSQANLHSCEN
jgi:beta-glucan synthesis-associated protein KRE6